MTLSLDIEQRIQEMHKKNLKINPGALFFPPVNAKVCDICGMGIREPKFKSQEKYRRCFECKRMVKKVYYEKYKDTKW